MDESKIRRINELAKKSRETGLNDEEKKEQAALRKEYILAVRKNLRSQLELLRHADADNNNLPPS